MKAPADKPDTVALLVSTLYRGSGTAAWAAANASPAATAKLRASRIIIGCLLGFEVCESAAPVCPGVTHPTRLPRRGGAAASLCRSEASALVADRDLHLFRLDLVHQFRHAPGERRVHLDLEVV